MNTKSVADANFQIGLTNFKILCTPPWSTIFHSTWTRGHQCSRITCILFHRQVYKKVHKLFAFYVLY